MTYKHEQLHALANITKQAGKLAACVLTCICFLASLRLFAAVHSLTHSLTDTEAVCSSPLAVLMCWVVQIYNNISLILGNDLMLMHACAYDWCIVKRWCSQDEEQGGEEADEEEDPQDSGFITKMFDKVATTGLGPSSLPTKVTPQHFQVCHCLSVRPFMCLSICLPASI